MGKEELRKRRKVIGRKKALRALKKATKKDKAKRDIGDSLDPPIHHGYLPFYHFFTAGSGEHVIAVVEERVKAMQGKCQKVPCGLWVGEKYTDEEQKEAKAAGKELVQGSEWEDLHFELAVEETEGKEKKAVTYRGVLSVRKSTEEKDQHGKPLNVMFFNQTLDPFQRRKAGGWQTLLDNLLNDDIAALFWLPPEQLLSKQEKDQETLKGWGIAPDEDIIGGG